MNKNIVQTGHSEQNILPNENAYYKNIACIQSSNNGSIHCDCFKVYHLSLSVGIIMFVVYATQTYKSTIM